MIDQDIRFATLSDVDGIMNFIRLHWKADHILAQNKPFFLYEYQDGNRINFVLALDRNSIEIVGVCGFIKNTQARKGSDIWGSLWKVSKTNNPMLGIQILEFIPKNTECRTFSSVGIASKTLPIYDFLRFKTGLLNHFYLLKDKESYQVATVVEKKINSFSTATNFKLKHLATIEELEQYVSKNQSHFPAKDLWYCNKRYFQHPIYHYDVYAIESESMDSILVTRVVKYQQTLVLRIVDFIGDKRNLAHIGSALHQLLEQGNYEYIDFYCYGIDATILQQSGFQLRDKTDSNIIPNYFEPFVSMNCDIHFFSNTDTDNFCIFKADGDQDRPSVF